MKTPLRLLELLWWRLVVPLRLKARGLAVGTGTAFTGAPIVSLAPDSTITIGDRCSLISVPKHTALGISHPVILRTLRPGASIAIGNGTGISGGSICAAISVRIGRDCLIGADCVIFDNDFHPVAPENRRYENDPAKVEARPVEIGDNVFIGTGCIVTKGVRIGRNSIIGAGSVVTGDVPANVIAAGNPAVVLRAIPDETTPATSPLVPDSALAFIPDLAGEAS